MISVDWLEIFGMSQNPIVDEYTSNIFGCKQRPFGSKMWEHIFEFYNLEDGVFGCPFAVLCTCMRGKIANPCAVSLKIANEQLYRADRWQKIEQFREWLGITFMNLSRVDLAADFIYLHGRVSGRQLVDNIKNLKWWKCGSTKIAEHYTMPYSAAWSQLPDDMEYDTYNQGGKLALRTESLTFGTKASFAQVCLYDKTVELSTHEVDGVSSKEYIRDCWKQVGCYDEKRHTWRLEIRMNSKAATIKDPTKAEGLRPLVFMDLRDDVLAKTFKSAADVWFRLVDATQGGKVQDITAEYCQTWRKYKAKFPVVELFPWESLQFGFVHRKAKPCPSRFTSAMMNKLAELSRQIQAKEVPHMTKFDQHFIDVTRTVLYTIYLGQTCIEERQEIADIIKNTFRQLCLDMQMRYDADPYTFEMLPIEKRFFAFFHDKGCPLKKETREMIEEQCKQEIIESRTIVLTP